MNSIHQEYINAYSQGEIQKGRDIIEEISRSSKDEYRKLLPSMLWDAQYYVQKCPSIHLYTFKPRIFTEQSQKQKMFAVNPFLVQDRKTKEYIIGIRVLNYAAADGIEKMVVQGKIYTHYEIFIMNQSMNKIINHFALMYDSNYNDKLVQRNFPYATGTEDYRVIPTEDENLLRGYCTGIETHDIGPIRMCTFLMTIQRENNHVTGLIMHSPIPLTYKPTHHITQKNWVPFLGDEGIVSYSCTPLTVISHQASPFDMTLKDTVSNSFYNYKNGTPYIPYTLPGKKGWLTLSHISVDHVFRVYYHRFFFYDPNYSLLACSNLFYFEKPHTVEFASGLVYDTEKECFYITLGFRDRFAHLHVLQERTFLDMMVNEF